MLGRSSKEKDPEERRSSGDGEGSRIAADMRVLGDCRSEGRLRIGGEVSGDVSAGGLVVTASGSVQGDVTVRDGDGDGPPLVVEGTVSGTARSPRVEVGPDGRIDAGIDAEEVVVRGRVTGGILARERLVLEETAVVEGDVRARRLALREGGRVNGEIRMGERAVSEPDAGPDPGPEPPEVGDRDEDEEDEPEADPSEEKPAGEEETAAPSGGAGP